MRKAKGRVSKRNILYNYRLRVMRCRVLGRYSPSIAGIDSVLFNVSLNHDVSLILLTLIIQLIKFAINRSAQRSYLISRKFCLQNATVSNSNKKLENKTSAKLFELNENHRLFQILNAIHCKHPRIYGITVYFIVCQIMSIFFIIPMTFQRSKVECFRAALSFIVNIKMVSIETEFYRGEGQRNVISGWKMRNVL